MYLRSLMLVILSCFLVACRSPFVSQPAPTMAPHATSTPHPVVRPIPWAQQLANAQMAARLVDPDARLRRIVFDDDEPSRDDLVVQFVFVRPSGTLLVVRQPDRLGTPNETTQPPDDAEPFLTPDLWNRIEAQITRVQISPREAIMHLQQDVVARGFGTTDPTTPGPVAFEKLYVHGQLDFDLHAWNGGPQWNVRSTLFPTEGTTGNVAHGMVDVQTGDVVRLTITNDLVLN